MPESLQAISPHVPAFMLVLARMAGLFVFAPMLASAAIPMRIKLILAVALSLCVYPLIPAPPAPEWSTAGLLVAGASEMLVGLLIGFVAMLPLIAMRMAGTLIGQQLGLDLAELYYPDHGDKSDVLAQLLFITALAIFLVLDGHLALFSTLVGSFERVPPGGFVLDGPMMAVIAGLVGSMAELAVRVAAPVLCLVFVEAITLGFAARTMPQLNILSVGLPLRIVLGLAMLAVAAAAVASAFAGSMTSTLEAINGLFWRVN